MLKRTIVISSQCRVSVKNRQMTMTDSSSGIVKTVPIEDILLMIIENQQVDISASLLNTLMEENVSLLVCDKSHMPSGLLFPIEGNTVQGERYRTQLDASLPVKKSLWRQIIMAKIKNQSSLLDRLGKDGDILRPLYQNVKSDDADNREGIAARLYWRELFGDGFVRVRTGLFPNNLLNYGYIILRSAMARSIIASGMLPSVGIHHKSRYNAFPLADDLMEPFRPYVDKVVYELYSSGCTILDKSSKAALINVMYCDVTIRGNLHPLYVAVGNFCTSVLKMMSGSSRVLSVPEFC